MMNSRIVMAPMTRSRAIGAIPNELMATYYGQRATAGLTIVEGTAPSPNGLGYARTPGIFNKEQVDGWKKVTKAVHDKGGKIFAQLMHVGRIAHVANMPEGARILAPSAVKPNVMMWTDAQGMQPIETPTAMTLADIQHVIQEFEQGARNAIDAGFDGVELHGANGYLLEQFLNPHTNTRTDQYGGSTEKRIRFVVELTTAVAAAIGNGKTAVRVSPYGTFNDMPGYDDAFNTYDQLSHELQKLDIAYLHVVDIGARASAEGLQLLKTIRKNFINSLILNGGYDKARAIQALQMDGADLVSFGSKFIANPNLPYKLQNDIALSTPDVNTFYTPGPVGYTDYV
jgi:N-ethylmaleimide reductase